MLGAQTAMTSMYRLHRFRLCLSLTSRCRLPVPASRSIRHHGICAEATKAHSFAAWLRCLVDERFDSQFRDDASLPYVFDTAKSGRSLVYDKKKNAWTIGNASTFNDKIQRDMLISVLVRGELFDTKAPKKGMQLVVEKMTVYGTVRIRVVPQPSLLTPRRSNEILRTREAHQKSSRSPMCQATSRPRAPSSKGLHQRDSDTICSSQSDRRKHVLVASGAAPFLQCRLHVTLVHALVALSI